MTTGAIIPRPLCDLREAVCVKFKRDNNLEYNPEISL